MHLLHAMRHPAGGAGNREQRDLGTGWQAERACHHREREIDVGIKPGRLGDRRRRLHGKAPVRAGREKSLEQIVPARIALLVDRVAKAGYALAQRHFFRDLAEFRRLCDTLLSQQPSPIARAAP